LCKNAGNAKGDKKKEEALLRNLITELILKNMKL